MTLCASDERAGPAGRRIAPGVRESSEPSPSRTPRHRHADSRRGFKPRRRPRERRTARARFRQPAPTRLVVLDLSAGATPDVVPVEFGFRLDVGVVERLGVLRSDDDALAVELPVLLRL